MNDTTIREERTLRIEANGYFTEEGTEIINHKMPTTFAFRGTTRNGAKVWVGFISGGKEGFIASVVVEITHYIE